MAAPDAKAAAHYYPAAYWFSLIKVPGKEEFPGTGASGNGIQPAITSQHQYLRVLKSGGCTACHQLGTIGTREIPANLGTFNSSVDAWQRRVASGQAGAGMVGTINQVGMRMFTEFADWTDRIKAGEVPPAPPRPQGLERNVVITQWDWADPKHYLHDEVSTDRRNPRVNANGPLYGALELSADYVPVLDPTTHTTSRVPLTVRDPATPATSPDMAQPSPYWGNEVLWTSKNNVHNPMLDQQGRLWLTSAVRPFDNPEYCKAGSDHPSAKLFPIARSSRHLQMYDPKTKKLTHISTCFGTHHLAFAEDGNNTLWTSGGGQVVGWLNTKLFEETGDEAKAQGWTALILDTNGNGKRDAARRAERAASTRPRTSATTAPSIRCSRRPTARSGARCSATPALPCASCREAIRRRRRSWRCTSRRSRIPIRRSRASHRVAWTSIATASSGRRSRAATWRVSIAASARRR